MSTMQKVSTSLLYSTKTHTGLLYHLLPRRQCRQCGKWLETHENTPKILIDPETGQPHKCDPRLQIVQEGKWKGYSFVQMGNMWYNKKLADRVEYDQG
jgi:hypothetical protein